MPAENGSGLLDKAAILAHALPSEVVENCWGGRPVRAWAFTASERHAYKQAWSAMIGKAKIVPGKGLVSDQLEVDFTLMPDLDLLAAFFALKDEKGRRLFESKEELGKADPEPIARIAEVGRRLSKLDALEETVAKSSSTGSSDSASSSASHSESLPFES